MTDKDKLVMKAIALCFKPFLKPEEAYIYTNLEHSQFAKRCEAFGIFKTAGGYYKKQDLDDMMIGGSSRITEKAKNLKV